MRISARDARTRLARLGGVALLAVSLVISTGTVSSARPSHADLEAAKAELDAMNRHLDLLVEQYDQARLQLQQAQGELGDARTAASRAQDAADAARELLSARAAAAYQGRGSTLEVLLGATSLSDFADRLEFVDRMAEQDADAATQAEVKRQEAIRAQQRLNAAVGRQQRILRAIQSKTAEIKASIAKQQDLVEQLETELARPLNPKPKRPAAPPRLQPAPPQPSGGDPDPSPPSPPGPSSGAEAAVQAAFSVIGVPYQWGGSSPEEGFDCSGLTMWSWAQAGVSLPHSSAAQYSMLPHVSRSDLQPGDLVFFYTPISHVGIYVGGGMMIHSPHTGGYVEEVPLDAEPDYVGAGRPG